MIPKIRNQVCIGDNGPAPVGERPSPPPAPPKPMVADQELDRVYHAIPEWVHRQFPNLSLSEKIKLGFEHQQKTWTETFLREVRDREKANGFIIYLIRKNGLDLGQEYWNYLISKDPQPVASVPPSPPKQAVSA